MSKYLLALVLIWSHPVGHSYCKQYTAHILIAPDRNLADWGRQFQQNKKLLI